MRVLVTGAAGSGTSTLGEALATRWHAAFFEADAFYWEESEPPFTRKRAPEERSALLIQALEAESAVVVAGSVMGWGKQIEDSFDHVIFLYVPTAVRLQRLEARKVQRFGRSNPAFLEWASQYDAGTLEGRSLAKHNTWLSARACHVTRIEGNLSLSESLAAVERQAPNPSIERTSPGKPGLASHVKR